MVRKNVYSFDYATDLGIDEISLNSLVLIEDADGSGGARLLVLMDKTGLTNTTTIADFLLLTHLYRNIASNEVQEKTDVTATASQTLFPLNYNVLSIAVSVDGIKLRNTEYTASNGTSITLNQALDEGSWVQFISTSTSNVPPVDTEWNNVVNTPTTLGGYGITDSVILSTEIGVTVQGYDATILNTADIGVTVQGFNANTVTSNTDTTFTGNLRTSTHADDNNIDFTVSNNVTLTATATTIGTPTVTACTGQTGFITIASAENITGWDPKYIFKTTPVGLTGTERFGYFVESESSIAIWQIVQENK